MSQRFPFAELVPVRCVTGDELLGHTVGAQGTPFVMVSTQPEFGDGTELMVLGYLLRVKMAVIVYDRQFLCMIVVQVYCGLTLQKEILMNKRFVGHISGLFRLFLKESCYVSVQDVLAYLVGYN